MSAYDPKRTLSLISVGRGFPGRKVLDCTDRYLAYVG